MLIILAFMPKHRRMRGVIPLQTLQDPRIILEDYTAFNCFKNFAIKSKNLEWAYFLDFLVNINLFKIEPTYDKAFSIFKDYIRGQNQLPSRLRTKVINQYYEDEMCDEITQSMFDELEIHILNQLESSAYKEFIKSQEYQELLKESNRLCNI